MYYTPVHMYQCLWSERPIIIVLLSIEGDGETFVFLCENDFFSLLSDTRIERHFQLISPH